MLSAPASGAAAPGLALASGPVLAAPILALTAPALALTAPGFACAASILAAAAGLALTAPLGRAAALALPAGLISIFHRLLLTVTNAAPAA